MFLCIKEVENNNSASLESAEVISGKHTTKSKELIAKTEENTIENKLNNKHRTPAKTRINQLTREKYQALDKVRKLQEENDYLINKIIALEKENENLKSKIKK